ncbi:MAG: hypothetical protein EWV76_11840 [Microcystis novacekii Mn_MB_F_20050700_S1]|uniref:Uncharacterized protein n=1 Tax=Microcystis novacekii Mn_MB_F_20050700_S1D TaxID=2486266 RepID=A0A552IMN9_9CHRO|nr:MAG: hypothetical protein EWV54_17425 [Microcystis novacekii Mn_MB_F_20050700_S1D]TRU86885.1 MAG: hypothetical protein EWV76_11840 [Microcystis novacekii Mn_MB_F_20050700_S1]
MRNPARERSRNLNREVWESPSVYGGEDVNNPHLSGILKKHFPTFSPVRGWDLRIIREIFFNLGFDSLGFCA